MLTSTYKLRWSPLWIGIGWLLIAIVTTLSLVPDPPGVSAENADKLGHVIAYGVLMLWFMQIYDGARQRVIIACGLTALGVGLEIAQSYTGYREREVADMIANGLGIALGWLTAPPRTVNLLERIESAI